MEEKKLKKELKFGTQHYEKQDQTNLLKAQLKQTKTVFNVEPKILIIRGKTKNTGVMFKNLDDLIKFKIINLKSYLPDVIINNNFYSLTEKLCFYILMDNEWATYEDCEKKIIIPYQYIGFSGISISGAYLQNNQYIAEIFMIKCEKIEVENVHRETRLEKNRVVPGKFYDAGIQTVLNIATRQKSQTVLITKTKPILNKCWSVFEIVVYKNIPKQFQIKNEDSIRYIINNLDITDLESMQEYLKNNKVELSIVK